MRNLSTSSARRTRSSAAHAAPRLAGLLLTAMTAFGASPAEIRNWKTWVISSAEDHRVPPPPGARETRDELGRVREMSSSADAAAEARIRFWDSGPPSYRWMELVARRQSAGQPVGAFPRAHAYIAIAIHDATLAAWNAKYLHARPRPSRVPGSRIRPLVAVPASPSYPSDYAATAAAAAEVLAYLVPAEAAYFRGLAEEAGQSRVRAGVEYPSDFDAGLDLGRRVAADVISRARSDGSDSVWTATVPTGPCLWVGTNPGNVTAANWRPLLLTSAAEFRPPAPPACGSARVQSELAEVRSFPRGLTMANLNTNAQALYWQTAEGIYPWAVFELNQWILEDKMERRPVEAARAYALLGAAGYDAFIASQDAKFTYWYIRPAQLDPSITPLFPAPNFPSYPSNHSTLSAARAEILAYLFPDRADKIRAMAKEAGDSRIWAGIHFQMDNEAGVTLGTNVARKFIDWAENGGSRQ